MNRSGWIVAAATGVAGLLVGRSLGSGPTDMRGPVESPRSDALEVAVSRSLREAETFQRASELIRLFQGLTRENAEGAARAFRAAAGDDDPVDLQIFLGAWARIDPVAALNEVEGWPIQSRRELGIRIVIREWAAGGHPIEAGGYLDTLVDPAERAVVSAPLVRGWALSGDHEGALKICRKLFEGEGRRDVVDALVRGVLRSGGPTAVLALVEGLEPGPNDPFAQSVARSSLDLAGREDPRATARLYETLTQGGSVPWLEGSLVRLAGLMRNEDPKAALEWLMLRPEGLERTQALRETMATWAKRDLDAAWKWYEDRRARADGGAGAALTPTDSTLLAGLVRRMARLRPEEAAGWALRLNAGPERIEMLRRVAYFWSMSDPAAADRWLATLDLAPADRLRVEEGATWGRTRPANDAEKAPRVEAEAPPAPTSE